MKQPWEDEPDRVEFEYKGYACLINRVNREAMGHFCGYVAIPPGHKYHGKSYQDIEVEVHGGLTYAHECQGEICHVPKPGQNDNVWWVGFDCAHSWDLIPGMWKMRQPGGILHETTKLFPEVKSEEFETYRDIEFVRNEIHSLVDQLIEAG